jgi:hypothetical protein
MEDGFSDTWAFSHHAQFGGDYQADKGKKETAWIACDDGDPMPVTKGERLLEKRTKTIVTILGWENPVRWDDDRDKYVDCKPEHPEANFQAVVIRWPDGKVGLCFNGLDLLHPYGPDDVKHLPAPKLHFLTYDEMEAMPDPEWLVDGLIVKETSALLFGKSNAFKSFLGIDAACSVATGTAWHGAEVKGPAPVLYIATEGARGVGKQRIPGWMEAHDIPRHMRNNIRLFPDEVAIDSHTWVDDAIQTAARCKAESILTNGRQVFDDEDAAGAFALVVIDIFGASMMGPETSDETARAWVRSINRIMREIKCAVLTVAHTGWADDTRARMHTHFWGSFDTRLKAEGDKDSLTTVMTVDRHKDADSTGEWGFRLDKVTLTNGQTTLVPRLCDEVETTQKRRVSGKPAVALQALSEALAEHGRTISGPNYPACQVVTVEQWRTMCDRHGLTDSEKPEAARQAFHRAKTALIDKGLVCQFDENVWKVNGNA